MQLFKTIVQLVNPNGSPLEVTLWIEAANQGQANQISSALEELTAFTGNAAALRAIAVQLIIDIDEQG